MVPSRCALRDTQSTGNLMWLSKDIVKSVEALAVIRYVSSVDTAIWNAHRRAGEPRMFSGWEWLARSGHEYQQGLKTISAAYVDAYWRLIAKRAMPSIKKRPRLRVVSGGR